MPLDAPVIIARCIAEVYRALAMRRGIPFWFMNVLALWTSINGVVADWNYTHLFNPTWGPHARFHDAVSISAGIVLGLIALFYLWRRGAQSKDDLDYAVVSMIAFWVSLLMGFAFPGTGGTLSEHPEFVPRILGIPL